MDVFHVWSIIYY